MNLILYRSRFNLWLLKDFNCQYKNKQITAALFEHCGWYNGFTSSPKIFVKQLNWFWLEQDNGSLVHIATPLWVTSLVSLTDTVIIFAEEVRYWKVVPLQTELVGKVMIEPTDQRVRTLTQQYESKITREWQKTPQVVALVLAKYTSLRFPILHTLHPLCHGGGDERLQPLLKH